MGGWWPFGAKKSASVPGVSTEALLAGFGDEAPVSVIPSVGPVTSVASSVIRAPVKNKPSVVQKMYQCYNENSCAYNTFIVVGASLGIVGAVLGVILGVVDPQCRAQSWAVDLNINAMANPANVTYAVSGLSGRYLPGAPALLTASLSLLNDTVCSWESSLSGHTGMILPGSVNASDTAVLASANSDVPKEGLAQYLIKCEEVPAFIDFNAELNFDVANRPLPPDDGATQPHVRGAASGRAAGTYGAALCDTMHALAIEVAAQTTLVVWDVLTATDQKAVAEASLSHAA